MRKAPTSTAMAASLGACPLCGRVMVAGSSVNQHHLVPKSQGGVDQFMMHRICHHKIHATFTEKELGHYYFTWARLQEHPDIASFVKWVQKKPVDYYDRNESSRRKA